MRPPLAFGHVAVSVPDLDAGVDWYSELFGLQLIAPIAEIDDSAGHFWDVVADVFGPRLGSVRLAHLRSANGTALEMFQFIEPAYQARKDPFEYWKGGFNHICFVDPEIEQLVAKIVAQGGKMRTSKIWHLFEGEPYKICYCEDPWGSVIELYSHSHEQTFSNQPGDQDD
jgi:catechol 2,3-dioxygenase-like lactoylglutathione lyase family enzyme